MTDRKARVVWEGSLADGRGELTAESSQVLVGVPVTWASRTEEPAGRTSPEELLAAAHAACYAMALSGALVRRRPRASGSRFPPPYRSRKWVTPSRSPGLAST
jgi:organic hydroperoxide reductase OsmC/OhrA